MERYDPKLQTRSIKGRGKRNVDLKRFIITLWTAFCAAVLTISTAHAQLEIDISKGNMDPTPIAVPNF